MVNLIRNGGFETFETATFSPGTFITVPTGSTSIDNWIVTSGNVQVVGGYWQPSEGNNTIDMDGETPGAIAQTFDTTIGQRYLVRFDLAGNSDGAPTIKTVRVEASGQFSDFTFDVTGKSRSNMGYRSQSWEFTAS
ncbi:choice-of-anchor C family protein [Gloeocapsa sp. PCC 73106]|uniref:choice-of-anchor C family protein n=1 Tax=Gloeocapsa sp. PCC 73106 TaxID=102232 RepID=UPI0002ACEA8A|nr:choice-of-anchor C family protein [Gloeocapsa sp. PCC 73106]ELR98492.1 Protein of unknown function, DUF642 [Gloeocapsa sp. PCC 73106]